MAIKPPRFLLESDQYPIEDQEDSSIQSSSANKSNLNAQHHPNDPAHSELDSESKNQNKTVFPLLKILPPLLRTLPKCLPTSLPTHQPTPLPPCLSSLLPMYQPTPLPRNVLTNHSNLQNKQIKSHQYNQILIPNVKPTVW